MSVLTKECPHCHEESFTFRELFTLDYFGSTECKACGERVRNDGFRLLLIVPSMLITALGGLVIFSLLPGPFEPFGFLIILVSLLLTYVLLAKPVKVSSPKIDAPPFVPNPKNDKAIVVSGWTQVELQGIIADFIAGNPAALQTRIEVEEIGPALFKLTFPSDIGFGEFGILVNYLNYPLNLALANRSILAVARATLSSDFHNIPESLAGIRAIIYVPENDRDYDVVYLQTETGVTLMNSFSEGVWRTVNEARLSDEVRLLLSSDRGSNVSHSLHLRRFQSTTGRAEL